MSSEIHKSRAWEKDLSCRYKFEGHYSLGDHWDYVLDGIFREGKSKEEIDEQREHEEWRFERREKNDKGEREDQSGKVREKSHVEEKFRKGVGYCDRVCRDRNTQWRERIRK